MIRTETVVGDWSESHRKVDLSSAAPSVTPTRTRIWVMDASEDAPRFDRSTVEGRRAEMAYLDGLSDEQLAATDSGHRYVTRNPVETPQQRAVLLKRLAEAEARHQRLTPHDR